MKKLFLIIGLVLVFSAPAFASCDYLNHCASDSGDIWTPPFVEQFAQNIIKNEIKKATGQDFEVVLQASGIPNLLGGKFKSLEITGKKVVIQGFQFSSLRLKTLCPSASIDVNSRPIKARENLVVGVWAELSAQDLINTISYDNYLKTADSADLSKIGISSYRIYPSTINVENNLLCFMINALPFGKYPPYDLSINADLRVRDGSIVSSKVNLINLYTGFDLTHFSDFVEAINNLHFPFSLTGNDKSEFQIQNLSIVGNRIFIDAMIFVPKT